MNRKQLLIGVVTLAVIALAIAAYMVFAGSSENDMLDTDTDSGFSVHLTSRDIPMGSPKAPILMVEYAAPTCPVCAHFDQAIFPLLKANYIDTGKVYYVFRVFPLSGVDVAAEAMARCLPRDSYFRFIDMLYRTQDQWDPDGHQIPDVHAALVDRGRVAGMSPEKADACINNQNEQKKITQIGADAQKNYNIDATPTFIVNGQKRVGAGTWADWQTYLDAKLQGNK